MESNNFDVIIIGGGIIGVSVAYELAKNKVKTAILEKRHIASGASGSSAAMLECQTDAHRGENFLSLAIPSLQLFPSLHEEIKSLLNIDFGFEKCGILQLALSEEEAVAIENEAIRLNYWGLKTHWLRQTDINDAFPALTTHNLGGALYEEDGQVVGERYTTAMAKAAMTKGVDIHEGVEIFNFDTEKNIVRAVKTNKGIFRGAHFVVAAGAWSGQILKPLNIKVEVEPVRGQLLVYDTPQRPIEHPVFTKSDGYIAPKGDGYTLVGTTVEKAGFDDHPTEKAKALLVMRAKRILPSLAGRKIRGMIAGLRPGTPDDLPLLGPSLEYPNLLLATGHYRSGILLSPITAKIIASLILGTPSPVHLTPFSPDRFMSLWSNIYDRTTQL